MVNTNGLLITVKQLRISLLGPPSGDLGRRTQGRNWPYGLSELFLGSC